SRCRACAGNSCIALPSSMSRSMRVGRVPQYGVAATLAMVALAVSPPVVQLITGRPDLSFRVNTILALFELLLLSCLAALLTRGRLRQLSFHLIAWTSPLAALAALEGAAIAVNLANRIAPIENNALLANIGRWPAHLMGESRWAPEADGLKLYRPWQGDG